jgi:hypothetical protein
MANPSIAWCPSTAGDNLDDLCIVTTNSNGAIIVYSTIVPDPFVSSQWISEQISRPGTAGTEAPAIAFGSSTSTHIAAGGPNGVVYHLRRRLGLLFSGWMSQSISGASGSVIGITVMPDNQVYMLTISSSGELIGWLGTFNAPFVQSPIQSSAATSPAPAIGAAMTVRSVSSSQVEVHVVAAQPGASSARQTVLTYFWSTYEAGSGGETGSFGTWQSNTIPMPSSSEIAFYSNGDVGIALSPGGEVIVTTRTIQLLAGDNYSQLGPLYCFIASSVGSAWNPPVGFPAAPGNSSDTLAVAVDANGATHSFCVKLSIDPSAAGIYQPSLVDMSMAPGSEDCGQVIIDAPIDPNNPYPPPPDPLGWDAPMSWAANGGYLNGKLVADIQTLFSIISGMTVRTSGEVDVAFLNLPYSSVALFTLPLGANAWNYNFVGFPDQQ